MEPNKSLEWMVKECVAGNTRAFRLLYDRTKDDLFRFVRSRVSTREDALDLLQECYVDLWKALSSDKFTYASDKELYGFLYTLARRRVARLYRFRKPEVSFDDLDLDHDGEEDRESEVRFLLGSVEKLGEEDQEVIRLRYFSGLGFQEIASLLGQSESAIKVRHHRAIHKLREILGYEK